MLLLWVFPLSILSAMPMLGFVTAWGLVRLRPWGWWCAVVWVSIFAAGSALFVSLGFFILPGPSKPDEYVDAFLLLITIVLLIRLLATRRQLFFPPKPAGEE